MIKIAHEAPLDIFEEVQRFTDYDYALVHLLEENPRYRDTFERAIKKGREVYYSINKTKLTSIIRSLIKKPLIKTIVKDIFKNQKN